MRGHIRKRGKDSYEITVSLGFTTDPKSGMRKRKQRRLTVHGSKKDAERRLTEILRQIDTQLIREPTKMTLGEWLRKWWDLYVIPSTKKKARTKETYRSIVFRHLIPTLGHIPLQKLTASDIQEYYTKSRLSPATLEQHHAVLHQALKVAEEQEGLMAYNPAKRVAEKPSAKHVQTIQIWTEDEIRRFLDEAKKAGIAAYAFYAMAVETGMRRGEICGLMWDDVDLERQRVSVRRTLVKPGPQPIFGTPKSSKGRLIAISGTLISILRKHKSAQNERKLRMGACYRDHGLVFAKDDGSPLQMNNFGQRSFRKLIERAGVRRIRFHDIRHTCATVLMANGTHPKIVQERLGHSSISMTLDLYSHVMPTMQEGAAHTMGRVLG